MPTVLETRALTKTFGNDRGVFDLDLAVEKGEVFGFLGPNGAGKTTTIRVLLGLARPTSGSAFVLGHDARTENVEIHRRVGYLPGELALFPRMTGAEHFGWFARARRIDDRRARSELIERFEVVVDRPVRELSKGNRQKIGIVLAFMHRPEIAILDEPTSGLDPLMQAEFERLLRETAGEGRTVFLSSHELDEVQRTADRVAIIKDGRLVVVDTVDGLQREAGRTIELRFRSPIDPTRFARIAGVRVVSSGARQVALEVNEAIGPVLRLAAELDPVDVVARHADLDELFMTYYRGAAESDPSRAR